MTPEKKKHLPPKPLLVGLGEVLWDYLPSGRKLGGAPANFACHSAALGAEAAMVSSVGNDPAGRAILAGLSAKGVSVAHVHMDAAHATGIVTVALDARGKPEYTIRENAAWDFIPFTPVLRALAKRADAVCFGTLAQRSQTSRQNIRLFLRNTRPACFRIFDLNLRRTYFSAALIKPLLDVCNVLKLNDEELPVLGRMLGLRASQDNLPKKLLIKFNLDLLALTRGNRGSLLLTKTEQHEEPAHATTLKDTVGAGDSFSAALAMGLLQKHSLAQINQAANRLAAFVCSRRGATPRLPQFLVRAVRGHLPKSRMRTKA